MKTVLCAYEFCEAMDRLELNYYSDYLDSAERNMRVDVPEYDLSSSDFYQKYMYVTVSDHSYRGDTATTLHKRSFGLETGNILERQTLLSRAMMDLSNGVSQRLRSLR